MWTETEEDLFKAIFSSDIGLTQELFSLINTRDNDGHTLLHIAVLYRNYYMVVRLVNLGADISIDDTNGWTPLHSAVLVNDFKMVCILLSFNTYCNARDQDGNLPIHLAAEQGYSEVAGALGLFSNKRSINAITLDKFTSLHLAAERGYENVVKVLCSYGADVDLADQQGNTALIIAAKNGYASIVSFLLQCGADYNHMNNVEQTFFTVANTEKEEMKNIVDKYGCFKNVSSHVLESSTQKRKKCSSMSSEDPLPSELSKSSSDISNMCNKSSETSLSSPASMLDISSSGSSVAGSSDSGMSRCQKYFSTLSLNCSEHSTPASSTIQSAKRVRFG